MKKIFKDECLDCGYIGEDAYWSIEAYRGPIYIHEITYVKKDVMDPEFYDLNALDSKKIAEKYGVEQDFIEDLIIRDGEPICPKCKSKNYFQLIQEEK